MTTSPKKPTTKKPPRPKPPANAEDAILARPPFTDTIVKKAKGA